MTTFSDLGFLFRFLPVMLLVYYLLKGRARNAVLFLGSIFFYAWGNLYYGAAFLVLILLNYLLARAMRSKNRVVFLVLAVLLDVGVLAFCKILEVKQSGFL
ncbi:MAG: MBOAT family protein, partial [Lachnospiraceae bacterium]|nr:MBOAT family protein [Lachnospiraceae bacterium]